MRPHPPNGQPSLSGHAFSVLVCRYDPQGNYPKKNQNQCRILQQLYQAKLWVKKKVTLAPPFQDGVGDGGGGDTSGDGGGTEN